jgi:hypothetical protein
VTWLSFCARRPSRDWKTGYGTGDRTLAQIEGVVDHSMEGSMAGAYSVLDSSAQSSWTFSLPKAGEPIQHYSLEKITWHAGLPGDRRQDTSLIGNLTLVGKEHEGVAGEPWTENQLHWSAKIDVACRALCPAFGANPPILRKNMWEHRWLSATSCPSGRNPWNAKFALINEWEDDMGMTEAEKGQLDGVLNQIGALRVAFGWPQQFGDVSQEHIGNIIGRIEADIDWVKKHANDANYHHSMDKIKAAVGGGDHRHPHQHGEAG